MQIIVNGLLTQYQTTGKGKLVLLLHGWGDSSKGLRDIQSQLEKKYTVLSLDLPGFGATQPPQVAWNLDDYAEFLAAFFAKLKLKQPYAIIGHSNGGALAIRTIALGKLQPSKLILLAASGIRTSQKGKRAVLKVIAKIGNLATLWMPERYRQALRKSLYGVAGSDALVVPQLQETFKRTVRQDVQADAAQLKLPVLLVYGEDDRAVPLADGQKYADIMPDAELIAVKDAAHFVYHDQPQQVITAIERFL